MNKVDTQLAVHPYYFSNYSLDTSVFREPLQVSACTLYAYSREREREKACMHRGS